MAREQDAGERSAWHDEIITLNPAQVVVLDETSTSTRLTPLQARAPRGQRAYGTIPHGRWESITLVATMSLTGMGPALQFPGALDRDAFELFIEQSLLPQLHPGQIISWDNLSVHKSRHARELIEAAGCRIMPTPRYSPDCNPIEQGFAKLKAALRRAAPRTFDDVVIATGKAMATITAQDARNFFQDAGYLVPAQHL
ncbi:MAG: IS630 family transposase [Thermomicrobiales bacterium]|nr:IS630 family transposase [Thermomicrobiales bacterium]MCO5219041.1 IS630 family transposase [Thermomicrobiales bacterium]MCO5225944.1 IS630 family transposase [Thermomicrobiales bacterium]MCO5227693.1 IS630 family transposase [Thermomicrobiales bacterium]MCO5228055.1 IS630 family transposase [Thermomicrobiales bacterium]